MEGAGGEQGAGLCAVECVYGAAIVGQQGVGDPGDEVDAALTDQAVESLRGPRPHLHRVLYLVYVDGMGIRQAAVAMARAESTVKANLEAADHALAVWFRARDEAARAQRERVAALAGGSFTS